VPVPVAVQLYTLRDELARDFAGVIRRVAEIGYVGVEPAGFPGTTPQEAGRLFKELELIVPSAHLPLPVGDDKDEVLDTAIAIGCTRIVSSFMPPDQYRTADSIKHLCERFNEANAVAVEQGMRFGIHNHWWEFEEVEGRPAWEILLEHLDPTVFFEVDTYWVRTAGSNPVTVLERLGNRAPLLHIKDGPCVVGEPMVAAGQGTMDIPAIVAAGEGHTKWLVVELDACATDMFEAVEASYRYLVGNGLAQGNQPVEG
jgi:sugar phosphate isomerase/epimerase